MINKNVSEFFFRFTDMLSDIFDNSKIEQHELFFLFSAYRHLLERLLDKYENELTPEQREANKVQLDKFLERIAELEDKIIDQLPELFAVSIPLFIPPDMIEKWDPERIEGEVRIEAAEWLNRGAKRVIGKPTTWAKITQEDCADSVRIVQSLYEKGATWVEVVDPPVCTDRGGCAHFIRVTLPWNPAEGGALGDAPLVDRALETLAYISELDACSIKQDPHVENAFYISWVEEGPSDPGT